MSALLKVSESFNLFDEHVRVFHSLIDECITRYYFVGVIPFSKDFWIVDLIDEVLIKKHNFIDYVGQPVANYWWKSMHCNRVSFATLNLRDRNQWAITTRGQSMLQKMHEDQSPVVVRDVKPVFVDQSKTHDNTPQDLITRRLSILNVKSVDHVSVGGGGKLRTLGWAEISAALSFAQLDDVSYLLVRVVHCYDRTSMLNLVASLTDRLAVTSTDANADGAARSVTRGLVVAALVDYLEPEEKRPVSRRKRADIVGVPETTYRRKDYDTKVDEIINMLHDYYDVARSKIYKQIAINS